MFNFTTLNDSTVLSEALELSKAGGYATFKLQSTNYLLLTKGIGDEPSCYNEVTNEIYKAVTDGYKYLVIAKYANGDIIIRTVWFNPAKLMDDEDNTATIDVITLGDDD